MSEPTPPTIARLTNPLKPSGIRVRSAISPDTHFLGGAWIVKSEYDYLFDGVLHGVHSAQSSIIGHIILKLNTKLRELNIQPHYDPDNESIVAKLLAGITFTGDPCPGSGGSAAPNPIPEHPTGLAGPAHSEPDRSASAPSKRGATARVRNRKPNKKSQRSDNASGNQS